MKRFIVIAYDIEDNRKRNRIAKILKERNGKRVNKSVFECFLSDTELKNIKKQLGTLVKKSDDSVLYYPLCRECMEKREHQGWYAAPLPETVKVF